MVPRSSSSSRPTEAPDGTRFLLGVDADDVAYFGVGGPLPDVPAAATALVTAGRAAPAGLREAGTLLTDRDAGLMTHAVALANWHAVAGFCSRCGAPTKPGTGRPLAPVHGRWQRALPAL